MSDAAARLTVHGRVQGVFFRASTQDAARSLGLSGWVKNLPDGGVEVHAEGEETRVRELVSWCRRGPPAAEVSRVDVDWVEPEGLSGFHIRR